MHEQTIPKKQFLLFQTISLYVRIRSIETDQSMYVRIEINQSNEHMERTSLC